MTTKSLTWNGKALTDKMRAAQKLGVNKTMSHCVQHAKDNHPWKNRTGILEGSINIASPAAEVPGGVEGTWGSQDAVQALALELGATIEPKNAKALAIPQPDGSVRFAKRVVIPPYPYLRPAADQVYPQLAGNVRKAFENQGGGSASS